MNLDVGVDSVYHLLGSVTNVLTAKIVLMKKIVSYRLVLPFILQNQSLLHLL
jgi:hypothetical protein